MPNPPRWVLDTNVVVAGLLWQGPPRRLLEAAIEGVIECFTSAVLLDELSRTLEYPKFDTRIRDLGADRESMVANYATLSSLVSPARVQRVVMRDADDDHVIAAALAARAVMIVSGDRKHLLPIGRHEGIDIVTPREALDRLNLA